MYTYYDWHLMRELLFLLVFCLFVDLRGPDRDGASPEGQA